MAEQSAALSFTVRALLM